MSTPSFAFPQPLAEKYRTRAIHDFVGLEKPKRILGKFAANPYPSAWLFVGRRESAKLVWRSRWLKCSVQSYITSHHSNAMSRQSKT